MRLDGDRIVLETVTDARVAADAGALGGEYGVTEAFRHVKEADLPMTMGRLTSQDVIAGLRMVVKANTAIGEGRYLDQAVASGYLTALGYSSTTHE